MDWSRPLLMLTMPNTGSTWLASTIAECLPGCRYYDKEFFNPVCNLKHEMALRRNFGSELVSCVNNIASPGDEWIDDDIVATWGAEEFNFTKECQSAFKLAAFMRHFRVFVFLRPFAQSFPPGRVRVWSFYEHAWWSLRRRGFEVRSESTCDRAREAFGVIYHSLRDEAGAAGVPIVYFDDLFLGPDALSAKLAAAIPATDAEAGRLAEAIAATRWRAGGRPVAGPWGS